MTTAAIVIFAPVFAIAIGWYLGRNQVDPTSPQGRAYYASHKDARK